MRDADDGGHSGDLQAAVEQIPKAASTPRKAIPRWLAAGSSLEPTTFRAVSWLGEILPVLLAKLGNRYGRIETEGGDRPHPTARAEEPHNAWDVPVAI